MLGAFAIDAARGPSGCLGVGHPGNARDVVNYVLQRAPRVEQDQLAEAIDRAVDALASGLLALGLEKGDRVGIWSPNRLEWVLTQFATARIGAILVNINPAYRLSELEYALNKTRAKAIIAATRFKTS